MARVLTIRNLYEKKYNYLPLSGEWKVIGDKTEDSGIWLIYGKEKNGKTTFALKMAYYLSSITKVLYASVEEGDQSNIAETCMRVGIPIDSKTIGVQPYPTFKEIIQKVEMRKSAQVIFIDNLTEFSGEIKQKDISMLLKKFPKKLFVFLAHEDEGRKGEPKGELARFCKKKAKRIFHVVGLSAQVLGRTETAFIPVDNEKAALFHGDTINQNNQLYESNQ